MLVLAIILLILGFVLKIPILWTIGIIVLIIGAILWILGAVGRPVAGRRYWYYHRAPAPVKSASNHPPDSDCHNASYDSAPQGLEAATHEH